MTAIFGKDRKMRVLEKNILILAFVLLAGFIPAVCFAAEDANIWGDGPEGGRGRNVELTEEQIERAMAKISEVDPKKVGELEKLRQENPDQFKAEVRDFIRKPRMRGRKPGEYDGRRTSRNRPEEKRPMGGRSESFKKNQEFIKWFEKNYSEDANELNALKKTDLGKFHKKVNYMSRKYGHIVGVDKYHPELASVLKDDMDLKDKREEVLGKLKTAKTDKERTLLNAELKDIVGQRFDIIIKRKQLRYERMQKRLERMKEKIAENQEELATLKNQKNAEIDKRIKSLVGKTEEINWE